MRGIRLLTAYWLTMIAAGVFIFGLAMSAQGLAAAFLPRRHFLRVSSFLQLATFCLIVGTYVLQPMVVRPDVILAAQNGECLASPSFWFLGLFQELSGSPASRRWRQCVGGPGTGRPRTAIACLASYLRTLRQIAEQPDIAARRPGCDGCRPLGTALQTASCSSASGP